MIHLIFFISIWELFRLNRFYGLNSKKIIRNSNFILTRTKLEIVDYFVLVILSFALFIFSISNDINIMYVIFIFISLSFFLKIYSIKIILCLFYFSFPFFLLSYYRENNDFYFFFVYIISFTILTDVGAYLFGTYFGGKKMLISISPNKTFSGLFGGILTPTIFSILFYNQNSYKELILVSIILSLSVQLGDLLVSSLKRNFGVKDSSNLIPGHGGVLDRLDGLFLLIIMVSILNVLGFNFFFMI